MDLFEFLNTPLEDLYDLGILPEPQPERDVKQATHTFKCSSCGDQYMDTWGRGNPDAIAIGIYCTTCQTKTMHLEHTTPSTLAYRSRAIEIGGFCDDVRQECWECGAKERLTATHFSNGQEIKLCPVHLREYVPAILRAMRKREEAGIIKRNEAGEIYSYNAWPTDWSISDEYLNYRDYPGPY